MNIMQIGVNRSTYMDVGSSIVFMEIDLGSLIIP